MRLIPQRVSEAGNCRWKHCGIYTYWLSDTGRNGKIRYGIGGGLSLGQGPRIASFSRRFGKMNRNIVDAADRFWSCRSSPYMAIAAKVGVPASTRRRP